MEILKGTVRDAGYPDTECTYMKIDDSTIYYFINEGELPNGNYLATTVLKEGIGHAPYTKLGLVSKDGNVLIPFENKSITKTHDDLLLVEKTNPSSENVLSLINENNDPNNAAKIEEQFNTKKKQMTDLVGSNGEFLFSNQLSEASLFAMDGVNVLNGYYSFIAYFNYNYYYTTNKIEDQVNKYNPNEVVNEETTVEETSVENTQVEEKPTLNFGSEKTQETVETPGVEEGNKEEATEQVADANVATAETIAEEQPKVELNFGEMANENVEEPVQQELPPLEATVENETEEKEDTVDTGLQDMIQNQIANMTTNEEQPQETVETPGIEENIDTPAVETKVEEAPAVELNFGEMANENIEEPTQQELPPLEATVENKEEITDNSTEETKAAEAPAVELNFGEMASENVEEQVENKEETTEIPVEETKSEIDEDEVTEEAEKTPAQEQEKGENTDNTEETVENNEPVELKFDSEETTDENIEEESNEEDTQETEQEESEEVENREEEINEDKEVDDELEEQEEVKDEKIDTTDEDIQNPVIADATNVIKKLMNENKTQRAVIDKQTGELEAIKSNYAILIEDNKVKKDEINSLREQLNTYRTQNSELIRDNGKMRRTLMRQAEVVKGLEVQNDGLREQVMGLHALGTAVAEANVMIEPSNDYEEYVKKAA